MDPIAQILQALDRRTYDDITKKLDTNKPVTQSESVFWHIRGGDKGYRPQPK